MTPHIKSVVLPTGPRLPYVEQGDPGGVPVILLHGYSESWRSGSCCWRSCPRRFTRLRLVRRPGTDT